MALSDLRIHIHGHLLVDGEVHLFDAGGRDLLAPFAEQAIAVSLPGGSQALSIDLWPRLVAGADGLWTASIDGEWHPPTVHISIGSSLAPLEQLFGLLGPGDDRIEVSRERHPIVGCSWPVGGEKRLLRGHSGSLSRDGADLRLGAEIEGHRLEVRLAIPPEAAALPALSALAPRLPGALFSTPDWRPRQDSLDQIAVSRFGTLAVQGAIDWGAGGPQLPWTEVRLSAGRMHLKSMPQIERDNDGFASWRSEEPQIDLPFGFETFQRMLGRRDVARMLWDGPGCGSVDGITVWPMEVGGPQTQEFLALALTLKKDGGEVWIEGAGEVGPGGTLGPRIAFGFTLPSVWLAMRGIRF